jgi:hypothetical protein
MSARARIALCSTLLLPLALGADPALADEAKPTSLGGVVYAHWGLDLDPSAEQANEFDIDRVYLTAKRPVGEHLAVRVTTDMGREKVQSVEVPDGAGGSVEVEVPEDSKLRLFVKYAYLSWKEALPGVEVRFGAAGTPWVGFYDDLWGHRWVRKSMSDEEKVLDSSDLGVHVLGTHAGGLLSWQAAILNGEGYGSPEIDASKTGQLRLGVDPLAPAGKGLSLPVAGFVSCEVLTEDPTLVWAAGAGLSQTYALLWAEILGRHQDGIAGRGLSVTAMPRHPEWGEILLRYDRWAADAAGDADNALVAGLTHDFAEQVSGGLLYERGFTDGAADEASHGLFLRMQAGF